MMCSPVFEWSGVVWPRGMITTPALNAVPSMPLQRPRQKPAVSALGSVHAGCWSRFFRTRGVVIERLLPRLLADVFELEVPRGELGVAIPGAPVAASPRG